MAFKKGLGQGIGAGLGFGLVKNWKAVVLAVATITVGQGGVRTVFGNNPRGLSISDKFWSKSTYGLAELTVEGAIDSLYDGTKDTGKAIYDKGGRIVDHLHERIERDFNQIQAQPAVDPKRKYNGPEIIDPDTVDAGVYTPGGR